MKFTYAGKDYLIEFSRDYRVRDLIRHEESVDPTTGEVIVTKTVVKLKSTYPYTTAMIVEVDSTKPRKEWKVYRSFTVGCAHFDKFRVEDGRLRALRALCKGNSMTKTFKKELWKTYLNRPKGQPTKQQQEQAA